jgi:LysR family transcriptional regulator, hydrogen peroxide-inducible genes activator
MNIQQLEYIVAVDNHRHFAKASEKSFVTQPTLSMMIQKLEEELSVKIFDRSRQPVVPTKEGVEIIRRAKLVLSEINGLKNFAIGLKGEMGGELRLGIIPTLAPYLLPLFLKSFRKKNPTIRLHVREMITDDIIDSLKTGELSMGLIVTPVHESGLTEFKLFDEELFGYASQCFAKQGNKLLDPDQIDISNLWLMEEGHCLRNQVLNLCDLKKQETKTENFHYEAGSIETLINLVDNHHGMTIIPELATHNLNASQKKNICRFTDPKPMREISLVVIRDFPRKKLLEQIRQEIISSVPIELNRSNKKILEIKSHDLQSALN